MKYLARFILYTLWGFKKKGDFPRALKKYLIIAAPHTHWLDFPLAILAKIAESIPANYIGKASLFKPPFGCIFRALGGTPVDRSKSANRVEAIANIFKERDQFILGLSPEGTRQKVTKWKTGFYYIAKEANVPIVMATLNFEEKEIKISEPFYPTDNMEEDFKVIQNYFKGVKGKIPELS